MGVTQFKLTLTFGRTVNYTKNKTGGQGHSAGGGNKTKFKNKGKSQGKGQSSSSSQKGECSDVPTMTNLGAATDFTTALGKGLVSKHALMITAAHGFNVRRLASTAVLLIGGRLNEA